MALRVTQSKNAAGLVSYFREELSRGDYYSERGTIPGQWFGKGAKLLGLSGDVTQEAFESLAYNFLPGTEEQLTASMRENRRPGYDFTFSVPKSVSVLYEHLMATDRSAEALALLGAIKESVRDAMGEVEANMQVRVRAKGQNTDRTTENIVSAMFPHFQARPVDGVADPHLHVHAYVFNMTWDGDVNALDDGTVVPFDRKGIGGNSLAGEWKAGQFGQLSKDREYYEAYFEDRVAARMQAMGYATARDGKSFEVQGIADETRLKFSERTRQIEAKARKEGITDAKRKASLGARTRRNKETGLTPEANRALSHARLDAGERSTLDTLKGAHAPKVLGDEESFTYAEEYWFSRKSAVPEKRFLAEALKAGVGSGLSFRIHEAAANVKGLVRGLDENGDRVVTTEQIRDEERAILRHVREGRASAESFADIGRRNGKDEYIVQDRRLSNEQRLVVGHVLHDTNDVIGIMGHAGTGKSTAMGEVVRAIKHTSGQNVVPLAPTTPARDVLREDGFAAETVALFLSEGKAGAALRENARGGVVYVDEAGLLGTEDMRALFDTARALHARVILQGDTKQHQAVKRGDALRLLEKKSGLAFASIKTIRRQENAAYRSAVESLVAGDTAEGFDKLDAMGAIREVGNSAKRYQGIAESYAAKISDGHTAVVVAPTHQEIDKVTDAIRAKLDATGRLGKKRDEPAFRLASKGWTDAVRGSAHGYEAGQVIEFSRNAPGFKKGDRATVWKAENGEVTVLRHGKELEQVTLDLSKAKAFDVFERRELSLAVGDLVRVTQGQTDAAGKRLERGAIYEVREFAHDRSLLLSKPGEAVSRRVNAGNALHLAHGYATTSHASQSLTRHHVIAAMGSESFAATSWEQFYVTLTRGKWSVEIWTDAKDELRDEVARSGKRSFALDVKPDQKPRDTRAVAKPPEESPEMAARRSRVARFVETARNLLRRNRQGTAREKHLGVLARVNRDAPAVDPSPLPKTQVSETTISRVTRSRAEEVHRSQQEEPKRSR